MAWDPPLPTRTAIQRWSGDQVGADLGPGAFTPITSGGWPDPGVTVKISPRRTNSTESPPLTSDRCGHSDASSGSVRRQRLPAGNVSKPRLPTGRPWTRMRTCAVWRSRLTVQTIWPTRSRPGPATMLVNSLDRSTVAISAAYLNARSLVLGGIAVLRLS
jgi:hypothetical protein